MTQTEASHHLDTPDQVADEAAHLRGQLEQLLAPGGLNRTNVAALARWFDGPLYRLLDANDALLAMS